MKTAENGKGRLGIILIIGMVVAGAAALPLIADAGGGGELLTILFLGFFGAIITVQVIPMIMLLGAVVKGIVRALRRENAEEAVKR